MDVFVSNCHDRVKSLARLLFQYKYLLDSYVIEFFTEDHWKKLPLSWQEVLSKADLREVGQLLLSQSDSRSFNQVYPLSLLAFAAAAEALALPRTLHSQQTSGSSDCGCSQVAGVDHRYRRHVKPKKQHEIKHLAEVISCVAKETNCQNIIDVGSGQGHLARFLAYNYGLSVTAIEAVGEHLTAAAKFDGEVKRDRAKQSGRTDWSGRNSSTAATTLPVGEVREQTSCGAVRHVQSVVEPGCSVKKFLSQAGLITLPAPLPSTSLSPEGVGSELTSGSAQERHILVGLHTCGDLGATLMRVFKASEQIVGLISVACCYMKLSCDGEMQPLQTVGYPVSEFVRLLLPVSALSYEAREVACHSIETYYQQLQDDGELSLDNLKVHSHRAAVETVLRKEHGMNRAQVRISKRASKLPFREYTQTLLLSVGVAPLSESMLEELSCLVEQQWEKVAIFFMLRLALAPCVESLILLDRAIFLAESSDSHTNKPVVVNLLSVFDPKISPRNIAIVAIQ